MDIKIKEDDEDDFLDEYGNLKIDGEEKANKVNANAMKAKSSKEQLKPKEETKEACKGRSKAKKNNQGKGNKGWKDLDNVDDDQEKQKPKEQAKDYVKSAVVVPEAMTVKYLFPRSSSLTWAEQEKFLFNQKLVREGKLLPTHGNQWQFYQNFLEIVREEQEEFEQFTRDNFDSTPAQLKEDFKKYVTEHRAARISRPLSLPRWWEKIKEVRMVGINPEQSCIFVLEQTLLEMGKRPKATIPDLFRNQKQIRSQKLPEKYVRLVYNFPPDPRVMPGTVGVSRGEERRIRQGGEAGVGQGQEKASVIVDNTKFLHKESCIEDPNCASLAQLLVPDVIMSVASLKCLMDNHQPSLSKTWDIPFVVRTFKSDVDSRTVVIFGKPLLAREVNVEDCAVIACKVAIKVGLFQRDWEVKIIRPDKEVKSRSPEEDLFGDVNVSIDDLEVFGTNNTKSDNGPHISEGETFVQV